MQGISELYVNYQKRFTVYPESMFDFQIHEAVRIIVVIPCFNEDLDMLLKSLSTTNQFDTEEVLVLLVFNHGEQVETIIKDKHKAQLARYQAIKLSNGLEIRSIAAFDLPKKHAGVGLARKIGMDAAAKLFQTINFDGLIVCLDGDCTVSKNYFHELLNTESKKVNGLSIAFEHQKEGGSHQTEMLRYEIFLRYYIQGLRFTGYKHSHHTIGSSMAVRCSKYVTLGGMNKRKAGEDFYFLHKLMPHPNFYTLNSCKVFPLPRFSDRVPFGTGRAMLDMANGVKDFETLYNPQIFVIIKQWLSAQKERVATPTPIKIQAFIENENLQKDYNDLQKRSTDDIKFLENFDFWFDGFKMLKLVHFLRDTFYPNLPILEGVNQLFSQAFISVDQVHAYLKAQDEVGKLPNNVS